MSGDEDRPPGLHASELNGCLRQAAYSLIGTKKQVNTENTNINMLMRFDQGSALHAIIQDDFQRMCTATNGKLLFYDEVRISPKTSEIAAKYKFSSSTDGVFTFFNAEDEPYLRVGLEIKTMARDEFDKLNKPKEEHVMQATFYQKLLDIPLMWFLYYNKNNSNYTQPTTPWVVPFDKNMWARIESRAQQVHKLVDSNALPEREEGMRCSWCPYSTTCNPAFGMELTRPTARPRRLT